MIVYYHASPDKSPVASHTIFVAPAGHLPEADCNSEWWEKTRDGQQPKQFSVKFFHGQAEVPDHLGKYMIAQGIAQKSRLIMPNPWEH